MTNPVAGFLALIKDKASAFLALGLGTAATKDTGTATGNVPLLGAGGTLADARLSANVPLLDGTGSLSIPLNLEAGNAMIAPEYRLNGTDATIGVNGDSGALFYDGTPLLLWDSGGISIPGNLNANYGTASFGDDFSVGDYLSVGNHANFGTNASFAGGGYFGDSVGFGSNTNFGTGAVFADYAYFGNFGYFGSSMTFVDSFGLFGGAAVTVQPDAIADATDLASVIAATNALLAAARAFGFIAT